MELIFWIIVFIVSLAALVKGADWLLKKAEKIGLIAGLSPLIIGVVFVGLGTSLPELTSSLMAVFKGVTEIVPASVVGSNIANILLIVGLSAIISRRLVITKNLINFELFLLTVFTILFLCTAWDGKIMLNESSFLLIFFSIYLLYVIFHKNKKKETKASLIKINKEKITSKDILFLIIGIILLLLGARFLIDSIIGLSKILGIGVGVITLVAVAIGTSLPEFVVSIKAAYQKKSEIALGSIFGSNIFNLLFVIGFPGLFATLYLDEQTHTIGLPFLIVATFLFIISGILRKIHIYEGIVYVAIYIFFISMLFGFL